MLSLVLTVLVVLVLALIVLGFLLPDKVHVERETIIDAAPEKIFSIISDFHGWNRWSPWATLDPETKYEISGEGIGHKMAWQSDHREVGNGSQEIVGLTPPRQMVTALDFGEMGKATATFDIEPMGQSSKVKWSLDTNMRNGVPVMKQPMATFMGFFMEKFMDKPYTEGLASLKKLAEEN